MNKKLLLSIFTLVSFVSLSQTSYTFTNGSGDLTWETSTNWNPTGPPSTTDNATIVDYVVSLNSDIVINDLNVRSDDFNGRLTVAKTGSLTINGTLILNDSKLDIQSDSNEFGSLIINGPATYTSGGHS